LRERLSLLLPNAAQTVSCNLLSILLNTLEMKYAGSPLLLRAVSNAITHAYVSSHCSIYVYVAIIIRPVKRWSYRMNIHHAEVILDLKYVVTSPMIFAQFIYGLLNVILTVH